MAQAEGLVQFVKDTAEEELKRKVETLATREFVKDEINNVRLEIKEFKSEILRWMFIYWTGTVLALLGGMFAFMKFFLK